MENSNSASMNVKAALESNVAVFAGIRTKNRYNFECIKPDGKTRWKDGFFNTVTSMGLNHALGVILCASTQIPLWYLGLRGAGACTTSDTMSSHPGWTEITDYAETVRQTWVPNAVTGQSVSNSGSVVSLAINATTTVAGAFLVSLSTKGSSGAEILYAAGSLATARDVISGDTLKITMTSTMAAA